MIDYFKIVLWAYDEMNVIIWSQKKQPIILVGGTKLAAFIGFAG